MIRLRAGLALTIVLLGSGACGGASTVVGGESDTGASEAGAQ